MTLRLIAKNGPINGYDRMGGNAGHAPASRYGLA